MIYTNYFIIANVIIVLKVMPYDLKINWAHLFVVSVSAFGSSLLPYIGD